MLTRFWVRKTAWIFWKLKVSFDFEEINEELVESIQAFAPFGAENPRPCLASQNLKVLDIQYMGQEGAACEI